MGFLKPRTIRGQLMRGLILFEVLVLAILSAVVIREQRAELQTRTDQRLEYQASLIAIQSSAAMEDNEYSVLAHMIDTMRDDPSIRAVLITDVQGKTILSSSDPGTEGKLTLSPKERQFLRDLNKPAIFSLDHGTREAVAPVRVHGEMRGLVWIYPDDSRDRRQLQSLMRVTLFSAILGIAGCTIFASFMARAIARPLGVLMTSTRQLIRDPEDTSSFPIAVSSANEAADLTMAFNLMVASIQEQRAGLNDTLALLDSMLANAPIGFAFFDQKHHFVRVNQFLANMNGKPVSRHLGKTVHELFPLSVATRLEESLENVFVTGLATRDLELHDEHPAGTTEGRSWLANIYPVRTDAQTVRWVGMILVEITGRRRSEEALRKSEKLAATGRLAASIAHEINNPLEAVTNLLYLIRMGPLDTASREYADLAQHEVERMSEITQQMLRFYRQSTHPVRSNVSGLLDSVLTLHQRRATALQIEISRRYRSEVELFCYSGEMRQLFNNLVANAIDAMTPDGGRLILRVREAHSLTDPGRRGVRVTVADTGSGMTEEVKRHIFEPFFTTKEDTGTGLGLWVSTEILRKHRGSISIRSRAREGARRKGWTVFSLFFPSDLERVLHQSEETEQESAARSA
jgi:signal transduction histidine kinase